jgi:hypothetical protein
MFRTLGFVLLVVFSINSNAVIIDGKEWYQPGALSGISWQEFNSVCPNGECSGIVQNFNATQSVDITGWTWASVLEVNDLFKKFVDLTVNSGVVNRVEANSTWAPAFQNVFNISGFVGDTSIVSGWTSSRIGNSGNPNAFARLGQVSDGLDLDRITTSIFVRPNNRRSTGAWLFRAPQAVNPVSQPSSLLLLLVCSVGLLHQRRKKWTI